jgi:hypothetical protein
LGELEYGDCVIVMEVEAPMMAMVAMAADP